MTFANVGRESVRRAREHLEEWKFEARDRAYDERFDGPDAVVTDEELQLLDRIDSDLTRRSGEGLWDADEYAIVLAGGADAGDARVVCTYHPEIPYEGFRGEESLSEATREELNDVLWDYAERVATLVEADLETFLQTSRSEGGE